MLTSTIGSASAALDELRDIIALTEGLKVSRTKPPRSKHPFPTSEDLELSLRPHLETRGFLHHQRLEHPRKPTLGFEYDFWRPNDGVAMEIMGYRADDEIYKDLMKFHVHAATTIGIVWVPRYKWVSGKKTDTNYSAATKAVAFADTYMNVNALALVPYDWETCTTPNTWKLRHIEASA